MSLVQIPVHVPVLQLLEATVNKYIVIVNIVRENCASNTIV